MAGLANLFTRDYFETVKQRLDEDGIFIQWTNAYDMDWDSFSMIGRTFAEVFPDGLLVRTIGTSDFLLVGFAGEKNLDLETARKNLPYAMQSSNVTIRDPRVLFNLIVTEELGDFFGTGPLHTDNWPHLEFAAPKNIGRSSRTIEDKIQNEALISKEVAAIVEENRDIDSALDFLELMTVGTAPPFNETDLKLATQPQKDRYQDILETYCSDEYVTDYDIFSDSNDRKTCAGLQLARIKDHLANDPDDSTAHYRLAMGLGALGDAAGKIDSLQTAISLKPAFFDAYMELGQTLAAIGQFDAAADQLMAALEINPEAAMAYNNLGNVYADQGKIDQAVNAFKKAFKIDPDFAKAYNNLGCVYANLADSDEAIHYFTKALDIEPDYAAAHNNLGRIYASMGRLEDALPHFLEAVRIAPKTAVFYNDAGLVQGQLGHMDASVELFTEALRLDPTLVIAHYNLGLALLNQGQTEAAIQELNIAAEKYPEDPEVHQMLGFALGNLNRFEEAAGHLTKAAQLNPGSAATHDNLGVALLQLGRIEEAIEHFHVALDIDDSLESALNHLQIAVEARENSKSRTTP
jgi:spermidine synthase